MALGAALVDKARVVRSAPSGVRVEGSTPRAPFHENAWFRCRLELPFGQEGEDSERGRRRVITVPTLLYGLKDEDGNTVVLTTENRLEVASPELGTALWDVVVDPRPMRRRHSLLGWEATIRRVTSRETIP